MKGTSIFDERAGSWDTAPRMSLAKAVFEAIHERTGINSSMRVLDFGAGTGLLSVAASVYAGEVTAMDTSGEMLSVLDVKLKDRGIRNVTTLYCDLLTDEHRPGYYDLIISSMTLHHVKDVPALFNRFYQVIKKGGIFAVADLDKEDGMFHSDNNGVHHHGFTRETLVEAAEAAGFRNIRHEIIHSMEKKRNDGSHAEYRIFLLRGEK
ncbi:MAG TPA: class I SAM-dependent methyltransferase [Spirochaetota bacterium]|nr:class I SAM-dependent methyltransferase [Spirochaetota bacterium]